jgi:hypothetical protein
MIRFGIYRRQDLTPHTCRGFFARRRPVAITLYPEVAAGNDPDRDLLLQHILRRFAIENGTFKRTDTRRFADYDTQVARIIRERFETSRPFAVHDMAVSDGRTSVEFFRTLAAINGLEISFVASDLAADLTVVQHGDRKLSAVLDAHTRVLLQVIRPPFVFNMTKRESGWLYPGNHLVWALFVARQVRHLLADTETARLRRFSIRLLAPECLRLAVEDKRFRFRRQDILEPSPHRFDLVRAMNVLNHSYFSDRELRTALTNIFQSLRAGGLLATGSDKGADTPVNGGVYERTLSGFRREWVSGSGSPVDDIIMDQHSSPEPARPEA